MTKSPPAAYPLVLLATAGTGVFMAAATGMTRAPFLLQMARDLQVDLVSRRVTVNGADLSLTPTEYEILRLLVAHAGKVLTHGLILKQVWGMAYLEQPHVLRVNISNLRRKLETDSSRPQHIITEPGVGYRLR